MLLCLIKFLFYQMDLKVPAVFWYSSTRMILAALTTLFLVIILGPLFIRRLYGLKTGQSIRVEDCPKLATLHQKKKKTPSMGGILVLVSMGVSLFLWMDLRSVFTLIFLLATVWLGILGGVDDYLKMKFKNSKGIQGRKKFAFQFLFASIFALYLLWPAFSSFIHKGELFSPPVSKDFVEEGRQETFTTQATYCSYYLPFKKEAFFILKGSGLLLAFFLTIIVVTGASNAVNLSDGLDGLAAGCVLLVSVTLAIFAFLSNHSEIAYYLNIPYIEGSGEIAIYLSAMAGACLGFLWYNGYPAEVFMGDTGSLALGGILGVAAVLLRREFLLALVGGVFVLEALSVIIQVLSYRYRKKKRVFLCAPLHHHFEFKGWPESKVVIRFWIVGLMFALAGLASIKFQ